MLMIKVGYPSREEERAVMDRMTGVLPSKASPRSDDRAASERAQGRARRVRRRPRERLHCRRGVRHARAAEKGHERAGAADRVRRQPRASIALNLAARAHAFLRHRGYVTPEDVKAIGPDVLRHRVVLSYEAEAEEVTAEDIVRRVFEVVEVP